MSVTKNIHLIKCWPTPTFTFFDSSSFVKNKTK
jgi:hypothetical protein